MLCKTVQVMAALYTVQSICRWGKW